MCIRDSISQDSLTTSDQVQPGCFLAEALGDRVADPRPASGHDDCAAHGYLPDLLSPTIAMPRPRSAGEEAPSGGVEERVERGRQLLEVPVVGRVVPGPVSYTHLRAHETVLDLVCRLLLEQ